MKLREKISAWAEDFRVFRFYFRKYRRYYLFGIGSLIVVDGLEAVPPLLIMLAINGLTTQPFGPDLELLLLKVCAAYMAVALVQGLMRFFWRKYIIRTSMFAAHDMRDALFVHLSSMAPGFFQKKRVGDLVSLSTNDIEAVRFSLGPGALVLFDALFYFIAIPPIMFWISPQLALISFLPLLVVPFFVRKMEGLIQARFRKVQDRFSDLASHCQEALGGVRIIKGSALEPLKEREFEGLGHQYRDANLAAVKAQAGLTVGLEAVLTFSTLTLLLLGGAYVIGEKITLGVFVAFQKYVSKLSWPMEGLGLAANIFQRSLASQKRVDEIMLLEAGLLRKASREGRRSMEDSSLELKNLSFSFGADQRKTLNDISLKIPAGERWGIAGSVGSGKSTLLGALARTIDADEEAIFMGTVPYAELPLVATRKKIAFVPQESFLFSTTIEENILYGSAAFSLPLSQERTDIARSAARLACVEEDVLRLPNGFSSILGERGTNLSGGQRQRITIARALARKPEILILDDCLSAVDSETERRLVAGLMEASRGVTLILASHRVSSFAEFDGIVLLREGQVVAVGRPKEVMGTNSWQDLARKEALAGWEILP
jgi:ATP-binding cassette, subfamily B, multidrug efflux pump